MRVGYKRNLAVPFKFVPDASNSDTYFLQNCWNNLNTWVGYKDADGLMKSDYSENLRVPFKVFNENGVYFFQNRWPSNRTGTWVGYQDSNNFAKVGYEENLRVPFALEEVNTHPLADKTFVLRNCWKDRGDYLGYRDSDSQMRVGYKR